MEKEKTWPEEDREQPRVEKQMTIIKRKEERHKMIGIAATGKKQIKSRKKHQKGGKGMF